MKNFKRFISKNILAATVVFCASDAGVHADGVRPYQYLIYHTTCNNSYKYSFKIAPKGIMIHSTNDSTDAKASRDMFNKSYALRETIHQASVNYIVDDKFVVECLPRNYLSCHCGSRSFANSTHISIRICGPKNIVSDDGRSILEYNPNTHENKKYFKKVYKNLVYLTTDLCKIYKLNPESVISREEGRTKSIVYSPSEPEYWLNRHGFTMEKFRGDVFSELTKRQFEETQKWNFLGLRMYD